MPKHPPFAIVIDQREKAPYSFSRIPAKASAKGEWLDIETVVGHLPEGDYAIQGAYQLAAVERKSLEDLYSTLGGHRDRFEREIIRLQEYKAAAVVIEADWLEIIRPQDFRQNWRSRLKPRSVYGTILSWGQRYPNVHWLAAGSRRLAEITTHTFLETAWRHHCDAQAQLEKETTHGF